MSKKKERIRSNLDDLEDMTRILLSGAHIALGGAIAVENVVQNSVAEALENIAYVGVNVWPILARVAVSMTRGVEDTCSFIYRMASNKEQLLGFKQLGEAKENIDQRLLEHFPLEGNEKIIPGSEVFKKEKIEYIFKDGNITVKTFKYNYAFQQYENLSKAKSIGYVEISSEVYKLTDIINSCSAPTKISLEGSLERATTKEDELSKLRGSIIKDLANANPNNLDIQDLARDNEAYLVSVEQETRRFKTNIKLSKRSDPSIPKTSYGVSMMSESAKSVGGAVERLLKGGKADKSKTLYGAISKKEKTNEGGFAKAVRNPLATLATPLTQVKKLMTKGVEKSEDPSIER